ncbi:MAG: Abi family protein [Vampirovibrionales bacterium]
MSLNRKSYSTILGSIELIKKRGLLLSENDCKELENYLIKIGYYRLSGYFWYFYDNLPHSGQDHNFLKNTQWQDVKRLYDYDEKCRHIFLVYLLKLEVSIKALLCDVVGNKTQDSEWLYDVRNFSKATKKDNSHSQYLNDLQKTIQKHQKTAFIDDSYAPDFPRHETWKIFMLFSFGDIVFLLDRLSSVNLSLLATHLNLPANDFKNILRGLKDIRNICAHSSRLWNEEHNRLPSLPSFLFTQQHLAISKCIDEKSLVNATMSLYLILKRIDAPHADAFLHDIDTWIKAFVPIEDLNNPYVRSLGLKTDWEKYVQTMQSF